MFLSNDSHFSFKKLRYCYECEWEVKGKDPDAHSESEKRIELGLGRNQSVRECKQGSEYQTVKYKKDPKSESVRTQTRVETEKSELHITCNKSKLKHKRLYDTGGRICIKETKRPTD